MKIKKIYENMLLEYIKIHRVARKFHDYKPQSVTVSSIKKWLNQFKDPELRESALDLLSKIEYFSEKRAENELTQNNENILRQLLKAGIPSTKVIYVSLDDPGSSSHIMLALLRDAARLQKRGCHFIDSKNFRELIVKTNKLGEGAIIYVDDFAGTGKQFLKSRNFVANCIALPGKFPEYYLLPCICDEALVAIKKMGVDVRYSHLHAITERPLHPNNTNYNEKKKSKLTKYCEEINDKYALGFEGLATMVSFYRNTPNTVPLIFRGNDGQDKFIGVIPRTTDLPTKVKDTSK